MLEIFELFIIRLISIFASFGFLKLLRYLSEKK